MDVKLPPHNVASELSVLGGLMLDASAWTRVQGVIVEHDFYITKHKILFRALMDMFADDLAVDAVTVSEYLQKKGLIDSVGGFQGLVDLVRNTSSAANISSYANIIREKSLLRQLIGISGTISEQAFASDGDSKAVIAAAESAIFEIAQQGLRGKKGFSKLKDLLAQVVATMEDNFEKPEDGVLGLATGFIDLDAETSGLNGGDLVVIAGRPSMGKTAFSMNIAEHVAINLRLPVAVFSMEMQEQQLAQRILSSQSSVELKRIRESWTLSDDDWPHFTGALKDADQFCLFVDDTPQLTVADIRSRCMRLQSDLGDKSLGLILIDYIQLMGAENRADNRNNQIEEITRGLKRLAKDFDVPVLALSQLNRNLESRPNKRPVMSDLRESGGIEQDADIILFLYRDEVYHDDSLDKGVAEVIIAKQRNGALGTIRLAFDGACTRFRDLVKYQGDYQ